MRYLGVLLVTLMLILAACGSNDNAEESEGSTNGSEQNNEETENTDEDSDTEASDEEQVESAMDAYNEAMEQFQEEYVEDSTVQEFTSIEEVANYFIENAPVTESYAHNIAETIVEENDGELTWVDQDFTVTVDADTFDIYSLADDHKFFFFRIAGDAEENRGDYTYNLVKEDDEWLIDDLDFEYLDGEHPDNQTEEDEEE